MKRYFLFLVPAGFIFFSSFMLHRNITQHLQTIVDSTPGQQPLPIDSIWIGSGFGWTHGTYHWISGHWEAVDPKKKHHKTAVAKAPAKDSTVAKIPVIDSTAIKNTATPKDSTTIKTPVKDSTTTVDGRIYVKGHRELQHNNYVWIPGHWEAAPVPVK
jgi:WXXGXW repeat (2 copies)